MTELAMAHKKIQELTTELAAVKQSRDYFANKLIKEIRKPDEFISNCKVKLTELNNENAKLKRIICEAHASFHNE